MQQLNLITSSNKTIMYDQYCKMLIGHPYMLARIISCFVEEAKHLSLDEIKKLIKGVRIGDKIVNPHFHLMDKEAFIKDEGLMCYDIYFYIDLPQVDQSTKRVYINIEIQNKASPRYHLVTRSIAYSSRMISSQWGREYDSEDYDGMKKVYSFWIIPQATKSKDGCINQLKIAENHLSGNYEEKRESYDKEEQLMIYLSKGHSPNDKYESYDEILMPIGALLNNTLNYQEKNEVIKEYGLEYEEFEERMRDMCNLGEVIELEALEKGTKKGTQKERIRSIKNIMTKLKMSFKEAIAFLEIPEDEVLELEDAFNNDLKNVLETLPHFYDEESSRDIYIPIYSPDINNWYINDYQILLLKQHAEYVKNQPITLDTAFRYYGPVVFDTPFSSLEKVYENESHIAYYYEELGTIYLFVKEDYSLICRMVIGDDNRHSNRVSIEDAKELVVHYEHGEYTQFIEYMYDHQLISDRTYKKLIKKVK